MPDSKTVVKSGSEKSISPAVIKRLPRYYRYLGDLLKNQLYTKILLMSNKIVKNYNTYLLIFSFMIKYIRNISTL